MTPAEMSWTNENQRLLIEALEGVRRLVETYVDGRESCVCEQPPTSSPALSELARMFGLSAFEQNLVLMCAGIELDSRFAAVFAKVHPETPMPTFSLALAALPEPHWSALNPAAPLRRWRLIELLGYPGVNGLTTSPLRIDERVLHFLTGIQYLDERLRPLIENVPPGEQAVPSQRMLVDSLKDVWRNITGPAPVIQLVGDEGTRRAIASVVSAELGLDLYALPAAALPSTTTELESISRLWEREAALLSAALYVDLDTVSQGDSTIVTTVTSFLERTAGALFIGTVERWKPLRRATVAVDVCKPTTAEQRDAWQSLLGGPQALNGRLGQIVSQFSMSVPAIRAAVRSAQSAPDENAPLAERLWEASRSQCRLRLGDLAQRIEPSASWDDLVLPATEQDQLRQIAAHVRQRATVYDEWGFGRRGGRGLGINALFAGESGTGKTMAAEVLAAMLRLDLYRIDLSAIVSKYIGETEKNLRRVFDAADDGGAILFFDEADALFGKRSEVKDSHDRYANIEINYLLQRMELYRGLAVLATNMKSSLDPAFMRRIRFVVNFPFPDYGHRAEIWRLVFPAGSPLSGLDYSKLARLEFAGGNIRNVAVSAAFLAAEAGEPIRMAHVWRAAQAEYAKLEKPVPEMPIGGWQ